MDEEEALAGGDAGGTVVRIGDTVRKPWTAAPPSVVSFVQHLRESGVDAPAPLGRDAEGRQVQEFVPGRLAMETVAATVGESAADLRRTAVRMEMRGGAGRISDDGRRVSDARGPAGCPA